MWLNHLISLASRSAFEAYNKVVYMHDAHLDAVADSPVQFLDDEKKSKYVIAVDRDGEPHMICS